VFEHIYSEGKWGSCGSDGLFNSGSGNELAPSKPYVELIREYIEKNDIKVVTDLGCGDFRVGKHICEGLPIQYIGVDIVRPLTAHLNAEYQTDSKKIKRDLMTLITGGHGFIGVNLIQVMAPKREVRVMDNLQRSSPTGCPEGIAEYHRVDILEREAITPALDGISDVVHLAAYGAVVESVTEPESNFSVNVQGTLNVLRAAVDAEVRSFFSHLQVAL
jgi:hypothetical protein